MTDTASVSRRERQVLDVLYASGPSTAEQIRAALPDPPSNSATRALLRTLVDKGHLRFEPHGRHYVYHPAVPRDDARVGALHNLVRSYFDASPLRAAMALVRMTDQPSRDELRELEALLTQVKERAQ
ncbi:MAG: BlaI/MecI/CopY family transcriptional regulator [Myxococcota bacterium]